MNEFIIKGETLQNLILPHRFRDEIDLNEPIKGVLVVENTLLYFYSCQLDKVIFGTAVESSIKKKRVFISSEFNKVFRLDPSYDYRVVIEEGSMTIYFNNGRLLFDLVGISI
ncbi:MAG: hypothetical protein L7H07_02885 [Candidatus Nanopusillus sp.]|nr:hypothetical protein [Candidatus Nanopusillus sp.]